MEKVQAGETTRRIGVREAEGRRDGRIKACRRVERVVNRRSGEER